ncbi:hypothetical protein Psi02_33480 [Planotetraspora silvatica]|uniref:STAS domain-containing protein n=1 Tax=Planotetraspora silvatica TaxID=234614 RepID=A0A8J3XMW2_9ACTN|nr:STAS domain-containing protein [Planotetraspora silvatica]GII46924.1 hypothetical protein Psi02_33480 [Planotetraspora silvatica]
MKAGGTTSGPRGPLNIIGGHAGGPFEASGSRLRITPPVCPQGLWIEGDLDRTTMAALTHALASLASGGSLFVDLGGLVFIDVGALRALVTAAARLEGDDVLTLRSVPPRVRRLLDLTGWHDAPHLCPEEPA